MKIYIDFDDVICETAKYFTKPAKELFGIDVPYREVQFFNLQKSFEQGYQYNMTLEQLYSMSFDFVIEDSPAAFEHVLHFDHCKVTVFNRPWNRQSELPNDKFVRCEEWQEIDRVFEGKI